MSHENKPEGEIVVNTASEEMHAAYKLGRHDERKANAEHEAKLRARIEEVEGFLKRIDPDGLLPLMKSEFHECGGPSESCMIHGCKECGATIGSVRNYIARSETSATTKLAELQADNARLVEACAAFVSGNVQIGNAAQLICAALEKHNALTITPAADADRAKGGEL